MTHKFGNEVKKKKVMENNSNGKNTPKGNTPQTRKCGEVIIQTQQPIDELIDTTRQLGEIINYG